MITYRNYGRLIIAQIFL